MARLKRPRVLVGVSTKVMDILIDPPESQGLVPVAHVPGDLVVGCCQESEWPQSVVDRDKDNVFVDKELRTVVVEGSRPRDHPTTMDPHQDRRRLVTLDKFLCRMEHRIISYQCSFYKGSRTWHINIKEETVLTAVYTFFIEAELKTFDIRGGGDIVQLLLGLILDRSLKPQVSSGRLSVPYSLEGEVPTTSLGFQHRPRVARHAGKCTNSPGLILAQTLRDRKAEK